MDVKAVGALRRQRDTDRDQLAVSRRNSSVHTLRCVIERKKSLRFDRRQSCEFRHKVQIGGCLIGCVMPEFGHNYFFFLV